MGGRCEPGDSAPWSRDFLTGMLISTSFFSFSSKIAHFMRGVPVSIQISLIGFGLGLAPLAGVVLAGPWGYTLLSRLCAAIVYGLFCIWCLPKLTVTSRRQKIAYCFLLLPGGAVSTAICVLFIGRIEWWEVVVVSMSLFYVGFFAVWRAQVVHPHGCCWKCGYDLLGAERCGNDLICPECGQASKVEVRLNR